jgi:hypothetical protein
MKTQGFPSFGSLRKGSFLDQATQKKSPSAELSGEEEKMINKKFSGSTKPLQLYEGGGSVRQEQPTARGSNIDITV